MKIPELTVEEARKRLEEGDCTFVDVRDPRSFARGRIPGAVHVNDVNVRQFVEEADKQRAVIVYCYHGHSSLGGADYFLQSGFREVYSLTGGFTAWAPGGPTETD